jgi:formylmethanofuran dehydrogenase subunit C
VSRIILEEERGKVTINSDMRMSMGETLEGGLISVLGSMEGTCRVVIMEVTSALTFT